MRLATGHGGYHFGLNAYNPAIHVDGTTCYGLRKGTVSVDLHLSMSMASGPTVLAEEVLAVDASAVGFNVEGACAAKALFATWTEWTEPQWVRSDVVDLGSSSCGDPGGHLGLT